MSQDDNSNEGADPTDDIKKQNPGKGGDGKKADEDHSDHKTQDLARAGRPGFDPNAGAD